MSGHDTAEGLDYVTWKQMRLLTIGIFSANVLVSVSLFALGHGGVQQTVTIEQAGNDRSELVEQLAREKLNAGLHKP